MKKTSLLFGSHACVLAVGIFFGWAYSHRAGCLERTEPSAATINLTDPTLAEISSHQPDMGIDQMNLPHLLRHRLRIGQIKSVEEKRQQERQIYWRWAQLDPEGAWQEALGIVTEDSSSQAALAVLSVIAERDPIAALAKVFNLPASANRAGAVKTILNRWARWNPQAAWDHLLKNDDFPGYWDLPDSVLAEVAKTDPERAVRLGSTLPNHTQRENMMIHYLPMWVAKDIAGAIRWAEGTSDERTIRYAYQAWAKTNPAEAVTAAAELPNNAALEGVFEVWFALDLQAALRKLSTTPRAAESTIVANYFNNRADNLTNAELIQTHKSLTGRLADDFISAAVNNRSTRGQYSSAVLLLNQMPTGEQRNQVIKGLARSMADNSPSTYLTWVNQWPPSLERDNAIASAGFPSTFPKAPHDFLGLAQTITEPKMRDEAVFTMLLNWSFQAPVESQKWMESESGWPAAKQKEIQQKIVDLTGRANEMHSAKHGAPARY